MSAIFLLSPMPGAVTAPVASAATALMCPAPAAAYGGGNGTAVSPYSIDDSSHLQRLWESPQDWDDSFVLTAAIDMRVNGSSCEWSEGIGTLSSPFTGSLNGDDTVITGLTINVYDYGDGDDTTVAGLFGVIAQGASVTNLRLDGVSATAMSDDTEVYSGAIGGLVLGRVEDVHVTQGLVRSRNGWPSNNPHWVFAGGIAGSMLATSRISQLSYSGEVHSESSATTYAGGIAGIFRSTAPGTELHSLAASPSSPHQVTARGRTAIAGGVFGEATQSLTDLASDAFIDVYADSYGVGPAAVGIAGGLIGRAIGPHAITDGSSTGGVTVMADNPLAGGVIGSSDFDIDQAFSGNSVSITAFDDTSTALGGGIAGLLTSSGSVTNSYSTASINAMASNPDSTAIAGGLVGQAAAGATLTSTGSRGGASAFASTTAIAGGLVGTNAGTITKSYAATMLDANEGPGHSPRPGKKGALIGLNSGDATASFWDEAYANSGVGPGSVTPSGLVRLTNAAAQSVTPYANAGWSITDGYSASTTWSWCINVNQGYPLSSFAFPQNACTAITPLQQGIMPIKMLAMTPTPAYTLVQFPASPDMQFTITPRLPAGLSLNASTGSISGTPTDDSGFTTYTVTGTDRLSNVSATAVVGLEIQNAYVWPASQTISGSEDVAITPTTRFQAAYFAAAPTYSISPALPNGLHMDDTTGVIRGTPTEAWPTTVHMITATRGPQTATSSVTVTVAPATPPLPPALPVAAPPTDVKALPGDASALVSWSPTDTSAQVNVTHYLVTSAPGSFTCITSGSSCTVDGLTNGRTYTFTVKALSAGGWSPASAPSTAVIPRAATKHAITIQGTREGKRIKVIGATTGLDPAAQLEPWIRLSGQSSFSRGLTTISLDVDGSFEWSRRSTKRTFIYVATPDGQTRSNRLLIMAR